MIIAKEAGVRMMKEYFEIKASKVTPQNGFKKGVNLFNNKDYQAAKDKLNKNLLRRGYIDMLPTYNITWDIRQQAL